MSCEVIYASLLKKRTKLFLDNLVSIATLYVVAALLRGAVIQHKSVELSAYLSRGLVTVYPNKHSTLDSMSRYDIAMRVKECFRPRILKITSFRLKVRNTFTICVWTNSKKSEHSVGKCTKDFLIFLEIASYFGV